MVVVLSRFVLGGKYVPLGPRFTIVVGFRYLLFLRDPVMAVFRRSLLLDFAHLEFAHLDSCPLLLLGLCLTGLFLWLFPSLERELVDGSEEELIQSFSSSSGKLQTHRVS